MAILLPGWARDTGHGRRMVPPEDGRVQVARYTMQGLQTVSLRWQFKKRLRHCNTGRTYCSLVAKIGVRKKTGGLLPGLGLEPRLYVSGTDALFIWSSTRIICVLPPVSFKQCVCAWCSHLAFQKHSALGALPGHDCAPGFQWGLSGSPIPTYNHDILPFILRYI